MYLEAKGPGSTCSLSLFAMKLKIIAPPLSMEVQMAHRYHELRIFNIHFCSFFSRILRLLSRFPTCHVAWVSTNKNMTNR